MKKDKNDNRNKSESVQTDLKKAIKKPHSNLKLPPKSDILKIGLPTRFGYLFFEINNIIRCQSENSYTNFFFVDGTKILVSKPIYKIEKLLESYNFFRISNSHLINLTFIKEYLKGKVAQLKMSDNSIVSNNLMTDVWFLVDLGITNNPYACGTTCFVPHVTPDYTLYYRIIAADSILTDEYIPESKSMARQYLFNVLSNSDSILHSDTLFENFYDSMLVEAEGKLVAVARSLASYGLMDSTFVPILNATDSLIKIYEFNLSHTDSICDAHKDEDWDCDSLTQSYTDLLENLNITRDNIVIQYNSIKSDILDEAELVNNLIDPGELPETNSQRLNTLFKLFEETEYVDLPEYYEELLSIAQQCPYQGGEAVYRARAILELVNDSLIYNDDFNCLLYGYYRKGQQNNINENKLKINVKPNPANEYIAVNVFCDNKEDFICSIIDAYGQVMYIATLSCNKENIVSTKQLSQGIYTIIVKTIEGSTTYKIAIVR